MAKDNERFWNFPAYVKWDELDERYHTSLVQRAFRDEETGMEEFEKNSFILFGEEEALLFRPTKIVYKLGAILYTGLLAIVHRDR